MLFRSLNNKSILLRTGSHENLIWNWDVANASKVHGKLSVVPAGWKDLASACMLCLQIVSVLQLLKTCQSRVNSKGENRYDLS